MARAKGIIAYGTDLDREKLAVLAELSGVSASEWLVKLIREKYTDAFQDVEPQLIRSHRS